MYIGIYQEKYLLPSTICEINKCIAIYNTYVRPISTFVWSPLTTIRVCTKESCLLATYVTSNYNRYSSVSNILVTLTWESLKQRKDIQSLIILYKILNGLVDVVLPICLISNHLATREYNRKFHYISSRVVRCF